ncbi:MAG: PAS domain-containing protein [Ferruginibacter sp.]
MKEKQIGIFIHEAKQQSDKLINYFLTAFFLIGLFFARSYDTWLIAFGVGGLCLIAYYSAKLFLSESILYQYVLATVLGVFMAQFIYQMHGLFEMHFFAFIASAILITYRNWKLQIPLAVVVIIHHAVFGYLQFVGFEKVYFTQVEYMPFETLIIHGALSMVIFLLCGLWSYNIKKSGERQIEQSFEIGKLQEANKQKEALIAMSENLKLSNLRLKETSRELKTIFNTIDEVLFSVDVENERLLQVSPACEKIFGYPATFFMSYNHLWLSVIHPLDRIKIKENDKILSEGLTVVNQYRIIHKDKSIRWVEAKIIPSFDRNGKLVRKDGIIKDISQKKLAEQVLRESCERKIVGERLMKTAEHLARFGSWQFDVEKKLVNWSDGAFRLYGYKPGEYEPSYKLFLQHVHPEDLDMVKAQLANAWENLNFQKLCFRIIDRNNKLKYLQAELMIERNIDGLPIKIIGFKQDVTEKIMLEQILAAERLCRQQEITEAAITAQEEERSFLGEELHDNINPILATVKLYIDCAITDENRRITLMRDAKGFVTTAMNEIRNLSKSVLPPSLGEVGLIASLNDLVENIERVNDMHFVLHCEEIDENSLSEKLTLSIYRIVQEQVNNILKYAQAKNVTIMLKVKGNLLKLNIKDDGIGFDTTLKRNGVGFQNIISRAGLFKGEVLINSAPGKGCELVVDFINEVMPVMNNFAKAS